MEVLNGPVMAASAKACHAKGCKKYTCFYHILVNKSNENFSKHIGDISC